MWSDQKSSLQLQKIFEISEIYSEKKTLQGYSPKKEKKKKPNLCKYQQEGRKKV